MCCDFLGACIAGAPLSAMDGVLVAVKDEIDCLPYQTTGKIKHKFFVF